MADAASFGAIRAGEFLAGRYRLRGLLGRGAMSEVWEADDVDLGRPVALKLLAPDADRERFAREARAVASLGHENVVRIYDYGELDGRPFIALEHLGGGTLEDRLKAGEPLSGAEVERLAKEIAGGLEQAHSHGIVHRDLKPSNVLLDDNGHAKLADFGIARMAAGGGTLTEAGSVLGTAAYISPEQVEGETATAASDVYSFGVILFRMLAGHLPFEAEDPLALLVMHVSVEPPPASSYRGDAPPALVSTTVASLAKDPRARPQSGAELLASLDAAHTDPASATVMLAPGEAGLPPASGPGPRMRRPRRRTPLLAVALLVLALAGGALAYITTRPAEGTSPPSTTLNGPLRHDHPKGTTTVAPPVSGVAPLGGTTTVGAGSTGARVRKQAHRPAPPRGARMTPTATGGPTTTGVSTPATGSGSASGPGTISPGSTPTTTAPASTAGATASTGITTTGTTTTATSPVGTAATSTAATTTAPATTTTTGAATSTGETTTDPVSTTTATTSTVSTTRPTTTAPPTTATSSTTSTSTTTTTTTTTAGAATTSSAVQTTTTG
ncbi:MAG TPA: serine/threonine-protein kinase [Gaiellaceae bacterium]